MSISGLNDPFVSGGVTPCFSGVSSQMVLTEVYISNGVLVNNATYGLTPSWSGCTMPIVLNQTSSSNNCVFDLVPDTVPLAPGQCLKFDFFVLSVGSAGIDFNFPANSNSAVIVTTGQDEALSTVSQTAFAFSGSGAHTFQFNATDTGDNPGVRAGDRISVLVYKLIGSSTKSMSITYNSSYPSGISGASVPFSYA